MEINREELKKKVMKAASAEEVMEIVRAAGDVITAEEANQFFETLKKSRADQELSLDELEAVSGGYDRDYLTDGCSATVEPGSWCWSDDYCYEFDVTYYNHPMGHCEKCGGVCYHTVAQWGKCVKCGHEQFWT